MKTLTPEEAATRKLANVRLAASTSFSESEVRALDELTSKLLRGGDMRAMARLPEVANIMRKVHGMKGTIERQRARRAVILSRGKL